MKICNSCGAQLDDNMKFCNKCGTPVDMPQNNTFVDMADEATVGVGVDAPQVEIPQVETSQVTTEQPPVEFAAVSFEPQPETLEQKPKKKKKIGLIIGIIAAVLVVVGAVVAGFLTDWFGLAKKDEEAPKTKPLVASEGVFSDILNAAYNTALADSLTFKVDMDATSSFGFNVNMTVVDSRFVIDQENEDITGLMEIPGSKLLIYDGMQYTYNSQVPSESSVEEMFESSDMGEFFEFRAELKENNDDSTVISVLLGQLDEEDKENMSEYVDPDKLEDFLNDTIETYFNDEAWLTEYMGYSKSEDAYVFEPDVEKLCDELNRIVSESDAFTAEGKEKAEEAFENIKDSVDESDLDELKVSITLKEGYFDTVQIDAKNSEGEYIIKVGFADINNTSISQDEIDEVIEDTEAAIEESKCEVCGEQVYDPEYHGDCASCGAHGEIWEDSLCYDCYYEVETQVGECEECGAVDELYEWDGRMLCLSCYFEA